MRVFFDHRQLLHAPSREFHNGGWTPYYETPARAEAILAAVGPAEAAVDHGEAAIRAVHDTGYLDFLRTAARRWAEAGREGDAIGYVWPVRRRRALTLDRVDALLGRYSFDASTPITAQAYEAGYWSAQSALTALDGVLGGERAAFALCRPPGHHAGADYCGGYGHLNAAAIAAQAAGRRVAVLDIDYHHGNGTQDIFYARADVFYASLHADPRGEGEGEGATLNLPLPPGTRIDVYQAAMGRALDAIARSAPELLIVSFGADTYAGDPISRFALETPDYATLARDIAASGWPVLVVMEGGYALEALGANVASFLGGF